MASSSTFNRAFAAGRGAASKASTSKGRGRGSAAAEAGKATKAPKTEADADEGVVTCANRGLLQKMLSNVLDEEDEVDVDDDVESKKDDQLGMSLRNVTSHPQVKGKVPIITSPPSGRPDSRGSLGGAARRMSLESQGRPLSRDGEQRSTPSSSRVTVRTGAPRPALATYVSQPRPGSRGAMPPAEVITSPGRQKPGVRPAVQPKSKTAAGPGKAAGYAGMHQARVSPSSAAKALVQPAAKPRCGPSAFDLVKKLTNQGDAADAGSEEGNFIMPSDEEDEEQVALRALDSARQDDLEDSAADYVARVKRDLGLEEMASDSFALNQTPQVTAYPAQARARSTDNRTEAAVPLRRALGTAPRSRSSDPRAHVVAARAYKSQDSDEEDDDDLEQHRSFQWKADVRSLVKNFAEEERARAASPKSKPISSPGTRPDARAKPPRAPSGPAERQVAGEEDIASSKKPRPPVEYTPATLEEYKQRFGKAEVSELGRLGPDLDDEDLLMKRAIQEKVKQFSRELHRVNKHRAAKAQPKPEPKAESKPTARAKAMQFAKNIPKPKLVPPKQVLVTPTNAVEEDQDAVEWEDLRRRERQHLEDVARIAEVKQLLERLAV